MSNPDYNVHVDFNLVEVAELDRKKLRKTFVKIGKKIQATSRALVSKKQVSKNGDYPGFQSGKLSRSIGYKVPRPTSRRPGLMVIVMPNVRGGNNMEKLMGPYYPAFLFYGVRRNAKRGKSHKKGSSGGTPWRIAPRGNFMIDALNKESPWSKYTLAKELVNSMKQVKQ